MKKVLPVIIVGSGIAGLSAALSLAPRPVVILTRGKIGEKSSSILAQGGIAAAIGQDDSPIFHAEDTLQAGAGICNPAIVYMVTKLAATAIKQLIEWGVEFDRDKDGNLDLGMEGAHNRRRIVHANGDGTGAVITHALVTCARATSYIKVVDEAEALAITTDDNGVNGIVFHRNKASQHIATDNVILATGGVGALWPNTTNPPESWGSGLVLAKHAGAELRDLEFVQFHPTAIDAGKNPMPLASESLRGEGAVLVDEKGKNIMNGSTRGALEPRDVVTRAIESRLHQGQRIFLDVRMIPNLRTRFPSLLASCKAVGINPMQRPIPVRPAAHFHMGGVAVDMDGRTKVDGLWACGEVSCTGLHGANRLASNSLLEAVIFGQRVARTILNYPQRRISAIRALPSLQQAKIHKDKQAIQTIMGSYVGILRDRVGLEMAVEKLTLLARHSSMAFAGLLIAEAALRREESRGAHFRIDFPAIVKDSPIPRTGTHG